MTRLVFESAISCAERIRTKDLSPVELMREVLANIESFDPVLHAFVSIDHESAMREAKAAEADVMSGRTLGALHGVPYSAKDNIDVRGQVSSLGLLSLASNVATADSPVVYLARAAGGICVGKTALPELGWDCATESPLSGITRNPWDLSRSAGGSSGGAGAALAAGMAPLAIATDGGGSIRQPAAFNGVVGFKPSVGLVPVYPPSRFGALGHIGPMARTVDDIALLLGALAGFDPRIEGSDDRDFLARTAGNLKGCRIGYSPTVNGHAVDVEVSAVIEEWLSTLRVNGAFVEQIDLQAPGLEETWDTLYLGATAKAYEQLPPQAKNKLSLEFADFIERAGAITVEACTKAEIQRHDIAREVSRLTRRFDIVVTPTTSTTAFPADRQMRMSAMGKTRAQADLLRLTQIWNMTGQPALSLPAGWTKSGMPVGVQIAGRVGTDALVLRVGKVGERDSCRRIPQLPNCATQPASSALDEQSLPRFAKRGK